MKIEQLQASLKGADKRPPVEKWDPPFCGDMDISIKADGQWLYMGTPISRMPLVKLFASVLTRRDGEYYLVTPVEKVRIKVEDAPFVVTQWRQQQVEGKNAILFTTNVDDEYLLSEDHALALPEKDQQAPLYLNIHRTLQAAIHRNVYYQLAELAEPGEADGQACWMVHSLGEDFVLGIDH